VHVEYVCVYVYMCACGVCVYMCVCACGICVCICMCVCMCVHVEYVCVCMCMCVCVSVCMSPVVFMAAKYNIYLYEAISQSWSSVGYLFLRMHKRHYYIFSRYSLFILKLF